MITWTNATNTTATFTFTTTNTASTAGTLTYHLLQSRAPAKMDEPKPAPKPTHPRSRSRFREGETVRVLSEGILHRRVGTVAGFLDTAVGVVVFVSWPGGGWTTFKDESLELAKPRKP